jgi:hypothetical protein
MGSNVGMGDDWFVSGSQGEDYSYGLNVIEPIVIDISLCSPHTNYDTKLEIFTADPDCVETTAGYYIDDSSCSEAPVGSLASSLYGVSLQPGEYHIVVDGYSGDSGNFEIFIDYSSLSGSQQDYELNNPQFNKPDLNK